MTEGSVVTVGGKVKTLRGIEENPTGTLIWLFGKTAHVLFPSGFIWSGPIHNVYPSQPMDEESQPAS